jgi:segregation and condensation protein A
MDAIAPDSHGGVGGPEEGEGASPFLTLDGFTGTLDHLLALARGQKIDLADISLAAVVDQLTATLRQAPATTPLGQKADWVLMAAWLVQLRARLLVSTDAPVQHEAQEEVCQLRGRLVALQETQALAVWLERRPQLGQDVFARGRHRLPAKIISHAVRLNQSHAEISAPE